MDSINAHPGVLPYSPPPSNSTPPAGTDWEDGGWLETVTDSTLLGLAVLGLFLNSSLIFVTFRAKWLHHRCNVLIALYTLSLSMSLLSTVLNFALDHFRPRGSLMPSLACLATFGPLLCVYNATFVLMVSIAVDRLLVVLVPMRYFKLNNCVYFSVLGLSVFVFSGFLLQFAVRNALRQPRKMIYCVIISTLGDQALLMSIGAFSLECLAILLYTILGLLLRLKPQFLMASEASGDFTRRIFKSLLVILLVEMFGLSVSSGTHLIYQLFDIPYTALNLIVPLHLSVISICSVSIILYNSSHEYKRAFRCYIPLLARICRNNTGLAINNVVAPAPAIIVQRIENNTTAKNRRGGEFRMTMISK